MAGMVEYLAVAADSGGSMELRDSVTAVAGKGLEGDRYAEQRGFYSSTPSPGGGRELTLTEAEVLEALLAEHGISLGPAEHRRNVTTRGIALNELIGKRFSLGDVVCEGVRLCEPCEHLAGLTGKAVVAPLVHRGGLRVNILVGGVIRVGDAITVLSPAETRAG